MPRKKSSTIAAVIPARHVGRQSKYNHALYRMRVARLFHAGKDVATIAARLNIDTSDVKAILEEIDIEWRAESKQLVQQTRTIVIDELLETMNEYKTAWEESKKPREVTSTKKSTGESGKKLEISNRTEQRLGNPAYLQGVERVLKQITDIVGISAPVKVAPTSPDGSESYKPYSLEDFASVIDAAKQYEETLKHGRSTSGD